MTGPIDHTQEAISDFAKRIKMQSNSNEEYRANFARAWRGITPPPKGSVPETVEVSVGFSGLLYAGDERNILYLHGGGLSALSPELYDAQSRRLAALTSATILVPRYRLAPEHPFPAAWEDALAAYAWLAARGPTPIVMGDSGGGGLAAAVAHEAPRRGLPRPAGQILLYPMLDMAGASASRFDRADWINHAGIAAACAMYAPGVAALDPRASPLREPNFQDLPPALIIATGQDPLIDEARAYAARLRRAHAPVVYSCYQDQPHGFVSFDDRFPAAEIALSEIAAWIANL